MTDTETAHPTPDALTFIEYLAQVSEGIAFQAGVSGCETAGIIISYLSAHPDKLGAFMGQWIFDIVEDPADLHVKGRLSWLGMDGKIWTPQDAQTVLSWREEGQP